MYLESLKITRFRSFLDSTIHLHPNLTVLLGENNGGKSNIIDAIRLVTQPLNGRRERYAEDEDLRRGSTEQYFEIEAHYEALSETSKGLLISAVPTPTKDQAVFGIRYEKASAAAPRGRFTSWAGGFGVGDPEAGSTDWMRHVYLPPLRDAVRALGSGDGVRVMALFRHFLPRDKEAEKAIVKEFSRPPDSKRLLCEMQTQIGSALSALTQGVRPQDTTLDFADEVLLDIARSLRFRLADSGFKLEDIRSSGLGYANLLFIATIAVELARAKETDLTLFLVEEPEAHLHPQLQMLALDYLLEQAEKSERLKPEPGQPEGRIQVIVTTHSPNLTAWVSPEHVVVVRSQMNDTTAPPQLSSVTIPIARLNIPAKQLRKISRYLDVTRSALLFGRRAILVEGIAEAILLPCVAKYKVLTNNSEALKRFKGALTTPIEGVDFEPYVLLLLKCSEDGARIADRVIVITDGDPSVKGNRKEHLEAVAKKLGGEMAITVKVNDSTLEQELFAEGNEYLLMKSYLTLHPKSGEKWKDRIQGYAKAERPAAFLKLLADSGTRKGDLAQEIARRIERGAVFNVPKYLKEAIEKAAEE